MALIECPDCKNFLSDKADYCPHCGYVVPKKPKTNIKLLLFIIALVILVFITITATSLMIYNHKSPMEKMVNNYFQDLKNIKGKNISPLAACVFKYTDSNDEDFYQVLIMYEKNGFESFAGFNSQGRYIGDGETHDEKSGYSEANAQALFDDWKVLEMKLTLFSYLAGEYDSDYSEIFVSEKEAKKYKECAVLVSVKKIK